MPVLATWEGCWANVKPDAFDITHAGMGMDADACDCLVVDVGYSM